MENLQSFLPYLLGIGLVVFVVGVVSRLRDQSRARAVHANNEDGERNVPVPVLRRDYQQPFAHQPPQATDDYTPPVMLTVPPRAGLFTLDEGEVGVRLRFGEVSNRVLTHGIPHLVIPGWEEIKVASVREARIAMPRREILEVNNIPVDFNPTLAVVLTDPKLQFRELDNPIGRLIDEAHNSARAVVGKLSYRVFAPGHSADAEVVEELMLADLAERLSSPTSALRCFTAVACGFSEAILPESVKAALIKETTTRVEARSDIIRSINETPQAINQVMTIAMVHGEYLDLSVDSAKIEAALEATEGLDDLSEEELRERRAEINNLLNDERRQVAAAIKNISDPEVRKAVAGAWLTLRGFTAAEDMPGGGSFASFDFSARPS